MAKMVRKNERVTGSHWAVARPFSVSAPLAEYTVSTSFTGLVRGASSEGLRLGGLRVDPVVHFTGGHVDRARLRVRPEHSESWFVVPKGGPLWYGVLASILGTPARHFYFYRGYEALPGMERVEHDLVREVVYKYRRASNRPTSP